MGELLNANFYWPINRAQISQCRNLSRETGMINYYKTQFCCVCLAIQPVTPTACPTQSPAQSEIRLPSPVLVTSVRHDPSRCHFFQPSRLSVSAILRRGRLRSHHLSFFLLFCHACHKFSPALPVQFCDFHLPFPSKIQTSFVTTFSFEHRQF